VFVDDSEENIVSVRELGVNCVLFPQPWNKSAQTVEQTLQSLSHMVLN